MTQEEQDNIEFLKLWEITRDGFIFGRREKLLAKRYWLAGRKSLRERNDD